MGLANRHFEMGHLEEAARLYEEVLQSQPQLPEVWHRLGGISRQLGKLDLAAEQLRRGLALKPDFVECLSDLGTVLQTRGQFDEAIACYREALRLRPDMAALHFNLGNAFTAEGKAEEALDCYCRAIEVDPQFAEAHFNLGVTSKTLGKLPEAIRHYRQAIKLRPDFAAAHCNLGDALHAAGQLDEAISHYQRAIAIDPDHTVAYNNLGNALVEQGKLEEALACYGQLLARRQDYAPVYGSLGAVFQKLGKTDEAINCYAAALNLNAGDVRAYTNLGTALQEQGKLQDAFACQCKALELKADDVEAHVNRSLLLLLAGDFDNGWKEYEWRWKLPELQGKYAAPCWEGEPLEGRRILLHVEQGLGDTMQFVRYAPLVKERGGTVVVECQRGLRNLLLRCAGIDRVVELGNALPAFDVHAPLLSLPRIFGTRLETIPADVPYLFADEGLVEEWRERLEGVRGQETGVRGQKAGVGGQKPEAPINHSLTHRPLLVGINWQGRPGRGMFRLRDVPLEHFVRLGELPGVRLISLQRGEGREELLESGHALVVEAQRGLEGEPLLTRRVTEAMVEPLLTPRVSEAVGIAHPTIVDLGADVDAAHGAFVDTAAITKNLDLVITSDTAVAHLAGALGVPVWVGLPFAADWRWLLDRSDSPWYPSMRLFRQKRAGDWKGVFEEIGAEVRRLMA